MLFIMYDILMLIPTKIYVLDQQNHTLEESYKNTTLYTETDSYLFMQNIKAK